MGKDSEKLGSWEGCKMRSWEGEKVEDGNGNGNGNGEEEKKLEEKKVFAKQPLRFNCIYVIKYYI